MTLLQVYDVMANAEDFYSGVLRLDPVTRIAAQYLQESLEYAPTFALYFDQLPLEKQQEVWAGMLQNASILWNRFFDKDKRAQMLRDWPRRGFIAMLAEQARVRPKPPED